MLIVCPHCTTSYAVDTASLGATGRTVRCSRCKEVWLARAEDAVAAPAAVSAMAGAAPDSAADEWERLARGEDEDTTPTVDSPPIAADWPQEAADEDAATVDAEPVPDDDVEIASNSRKSRLGRLLKRPALSRPTGKSVLNLPALTAAMAALTIALVVWRADVVRLLPQTATFYKMAGLDVNLRGVAFRDLKVATETVDGKPVLVIEGMIVSLTKKPVDLPRLRFSVRDGQGTEIYAWNSVLDQSALQPGERIPFRSRLASPPPEGRNIDIRFFNRRDITAGSA